MTTKVKTALGVLLAAILTALVTFVTSIFTGCTSTGFAKVEVEYDFQHDKKIYRKMIQRTIQSGSFAQQTDQQTMENLSIRWSDFNFVFYELE